MATLSKKRIVLTGGETGGHIYPLLAVAEELKSQINELGFTPDIRYLGNCGTFSETFKLAGIKTQKIWSGKLRRYFSILNIIDIPKTIIGFFQAFLKLYFLMPDVVFSKGGSGSFQVVLAAKFYGIPVVIHESDAYPGLTNLLSARFAKKIAISFEEVSPYFPAKKVILTGNPIRTSLLEEKLTEKSAKEILGFNSELPLVVILGGSQGSQPINEFIVSILKELLAEVQILHQAGPKNYEFVKKMSQATMLDVSVQNEAKNRYKPVSYLEGKEMAYALSAANLIIGRAGSGTIFEIANFGKPSILIPLPLAAGDHQRENAYAYAKTGAAIVLEERNFSSQIFLTQIKKFLSLPEIVQKMEESALKFAKPEAARDIAEIVLGVI